MIKQRDLDRILTVQFFISLVSLISFEGQDWDIPLNGTVPSGGCAETIKAWLKDIKFGNENHEWGIVVNEE